MSGSRREELAPVVQAAQRVAGLAAARGRGDVAGARELMASFTSETELAGGALLVTELSLQQLARERDQPLEECVRQLCVDMESALG